jgi:stage V sporulation protein G
MQITDIRIHCIKEPKSKLLAFAEITLNNCLVIKDFQIFSSKRGTFIGMPSRKMPDGTWREMVFAIDTDLAEKFKTQILRAYEDEINRPEHQL